MLDRTAQPPPATAEAQRPGETERPGKATLRRPAVLGRVWQFVLRQGPSSLTRRIVVLNLAGLLALVIGILYLSQFRAGLIEARVQSLVVQGEIIAAAIAANATADADAITIYPDRLKGLRPGESYGPDEGSALEFSINPERVAPVLRLLISPTGTRARIYDRDGVLQLDSRSMYGRGEVVRFDLPPPAGAKPGFFERNWLAIRRWFAKGDLPRYRELGPDENGRSYPEVAQVLTGAKGANMVRINDRGEVIVSVAVPVQRFREVRGALLLSTQGGEIDQALMAQRLQILLVFLVAAGVMVVLSILLAGTIAGPVRRLADAAEGVRRRIRSRVEIPRLHAAARRDRPPLRRAARDDGRALQPDRGDRKLRRRRRARAEESADLAALGGRDLAARQIRREPGAAARRDPARREAARPADHGHLGCEPARRRAAAPGERAGRSQEAPRHGGHGGERGPPRRRRGRTYVRGRQRALLRRAGSRFAPRPGDRQPDRQCPLVRAAEQHRAGDVSPPA